MSKRNKSEKSETSVVQTPEVVVRLDNDIPVPPRRGNRAARNIYSVALLNMLENQSFEMPSKHYPVISTLAKRRGLKITTRTVGEKLLRVFKISPVVGETVVE